MKKFSATILLIFFWLFLLIPVSFAHGAESEVVIDGTSVTLFARFDTGEPMVDAQVLIYPPNDPQTAWQTGVAGNDGSYQFTIDNSLEGQWTLSVRTAGHGEIIYVNVDADGIVSAEAPGNNTVRALSAALVVLALGAVAWFSMRSNQSGKAEQKEYARA